MAKHYVTFGQIHTHRINGITPEKPFCGKFYFEMIKDEDND